MKCSLKKLGAYLAMVCMLISLLPVSFLANPDTENQETTEETSKIEFEIPEDAIRISKPEDIMELVSNCRVNTWSVGKTVVLENDIDMSDMAFTGVPTFGGVFLGQGHTISGIKMNHEGSVVGFFRYLQKTAIVEGLTIKANYIFDGSHSAIGGFVGNNAGSIYNCTFDGIVAGAEKIGGFAGINEVTGLIENCTVSGTIYGNHFVGGFVGENKGVVRSCTNQAEVNTKSVQNSVDLEDITLDSLINTENASTTTDIGGIAGSNSGVLRGCINNGMVGYQKMGYNIGGIVGTQNGFIVECENYGVVHGRKEIGGIVGHMEPNLVLIYDEDTLQILDKQLDELNTSVDTLEGNVQSDSDEVTNQMDGMSQDVDEANQALDTLLEALNPEDNKVDRDKVTAATGALGDSLKAMYDKSVSIQGTLNSSSKENSEQMDVIVEQMDVIMGTVENGEENLGITITDVSGADTEEDTLGKVSKCINYGNVTGDLNIGGIAGVLAQENDLDQFQDTETKGETSLNATYQIRVVVRDCINYGIVSANKQYVGGITGMMIVGAILDSINLGSIDAIFADYVGGIAGSSAGIIRNCSAKSIISGDTYVGGIAGKGKEVTDCYAFVDMKYFVEKAGAVLGLTDELPDGEDALVLRNYYFNAGIEAGGIDGIAYTGSTDPVDVVAFLALPNLSELLQTVSLRFVVEGQDDVVITVNVGEALSMDQIPSVSVEADREYEWELVQTVTSEVLSMGESATVEYLSEDSINNILFSQTYKVAYDLKDTVIASEQRTDNNLSLVLAEGTFSKHTTIELKELLAVGSSIFVNGNEVTNLAQSWRVKLSKAGVNKLHYHVSDEWKKEKLKLYIQDDSGIWTERAYAIEGSYIVFDFVDGETGFALRQATVNRTYGVILIAGGILLVIIGAILVRKRIRPKKNTAE